MKTSLRFAFLIAFLAVALHALQAQTYHVAGLGGDGTNSYAHGINNQGQVVGHFLGSSGARAFLFHSGNFSDLGTLGGVNQYALSINSAGKIVGFGNQSNAVRAFLFDNGTVTNLSSIGGSNTYAYGINDLTQIVGYTETAGAIDAFLYQAGAVTNLGSLGGSNTVAYCINSFGTVVGSSQDSAGNSYAFIWQSGVISNLNESIQSNTGWVLQEARSIDDGGRIVGWGLLNGNERAFYYENGNVTDLGFSPASGSGYSLGMNRSNQVVGTSLVGGVAHAVLWNSGTVIDLNAHVPTNSGWILREAKAINDYGQIVGWGSLNGEDKAFLLTPPPLILTQPQSQTAIVGQAASFSVEAYGLPPLSYQWKFNGVPISSATLSSLTLVDLDPTDAGPYSVTVSNFAGTVDSDLATLNANYLLTVSSTVGGIVSVTPNQSTYAPSSEITLTATSTNANYKFYGWSGDLSGTNNPARVAIDSHKSIVAVFIGDVSDIVVDNASASLSGSWSSASSATDKYAADYNFGSTATNTATRTATFRPNISLAGRYDVYEWHPAGSNRSTNAPFLISYSGGSLSIGVNQTLNGGTWRALTTYKQFSAGTNGYVRLSNNTGEASKNVMADAIRFTYSPNQVLPPTLRSQPQSQQIVQGNSAIFTVIANGAATLSYQWRYNGVNIAGATSSSYTRSNVRTADAGNYSVVVTNSIGKVTSLDAALQVISSPAIVSQPSAQTINHGGSVSFSVVATGNVLTYQWRKDGIPLVDFGNVIGANTSHLHVVGCAQNQGGNYSVVISNAAGVVISSNAMLSVNSDLLFTDDFESGMSNWVTPMGAQPLISSSAKNVTIGGENSALMTTSAAKMYHNFGAELRGRIKLTFWMYDAGGSQTRLYGDMRSYARDGYDRGGLGQLFAVGVYNVNFGSGYGTLANEVVDGSKYQGRVEAGPNRGWFNLNLPGVPARSIGWHKFEIERAANGTNVSFYVDGVLGRTVSGADNLPIDCLTIGSIGAGSTSGNAWFDDIKIESYPETFKWYTVDSDGDGLFDWMELSETGTDPLIPSITDIATVCEMNGASTNATLGSWKVDGEEVYSLDIRGSVDYQINAPADDTYRIEIEGHERSFQNVELPIIVSIDGEYLGRFDIPFANSTNGLVHCFTPFIRSGTHVVRIYWDNASPRRSLALRAIRLQSLTGPDANNNGRKDWVENRLAAQSGVEVAPVANAVSPACIEGRGQYLTMSECSVGLVGQSVPLTIQHGAGNRWYANVPLSPNNSTRIVVSHQNGGLAETNELAWQITNLLEANNVTIRKGDSLLLSALPPGVTSGSVTISVAGVTNYTSNATIPVAHRFDQTGTFTVTGTFTPATTMRSITVKVVDASFSDRAATWVDKRRYWDCTNLPPEVVFESDPRLQITQAAQPGTNWRQYSVTNNAAESRFILARLGANGPIIANTSVEGFRLFNSENTYLKVVQSYPDGSQLIEAAFITSPVLPEVTVKLQVIVSGVTFDDGTLNKTLTSSSFDNLGIARVRFIRAAGVQTSVCHTTKAYQGTVLIGWP